MSRPVGQRILGLAAFYLGGGTYTLKSPKCPFPLPAGLPKLPYGKSTNCSVMTACILTAAYPDAPWVKAHWGMLQIYDGENLDSPIDAVIEVGVGRRVGSFIQGRWHLVQGWRSLTPLSGHAIFVWVNPVDDTELVLQASSRGGVGPTLDVKPPGWTASQYPAAVHIAALD